MAYMKEMNKKKKKNHYLYTALMQLVDFPLFISSSMKMKIEHDMLPRLRATIYAPLSHHVESSKDGIVVRREAVALLMNYI